MQKSRPSDTICALSSAPGMGAIAIVRLSGAKSIEIAGKVFSKKTSLLPSHQLTHGWILSGEEKIDEVMLSVMRSPGTYTGEDTVEITCHGSIYIQQRIIALLLESGARMADPGEFSMRAFLNGKMDLSQAEAVGDLIAGESAAAHKQAMHQMRGGFSKDINALREQLIHFASMIELELDFAEEDVEFADRTQLLELLTKIRHVVDQLSASFSLGNAIKNGIPIAILGAPNMGKSTLLNTLLNEERAIVSEIPGTTRDTVEDHLNLGGLRFRFIDTAGIRNSDDKIETMGIERTMVKAREAEIILYLFDAVETTPADLEEQISSIREHAGIDKKILLIANKTDKSEYDAQQLQDRFGKLGEVLGISAKAKTGIGELKQRLLDEINSDRFSGNETIVTNARHHHALVQASLSLGHVEDGIKNQLTSDLLSIDIRKAIYHLSEITGQISSDDLLKNIFERFCIGK